MKRYTIEETTVRPLVEGFLWLRDPTTGNDIAEIYLDFEGEGDEPTPESLRRMRMLAAAPEMEELVQAQAEAYAEGVSGDSETTSPGAGHCYATSRQGRNDEQISRAREVDGQYSRAHGNRGFSPMAGRKEQCCPLRMERTREYGSQV